MKGFQSIDDLIQQSDGPKKNEGGADAHAPEELTPDEILSQRMQEIRLSDAEEEVRSRAISFGFPYINIVGFPIGPEILAMIPEEEARKFGCIVFFQMEGELRVGAVDPDQPGVHEVIARLQHMHPSSHIQLYLISQHSFDIAMALYKNVPKFKPMPHDVAITLEQFARYHKTIPTFHELEQQLPTVTMTEAFAMMIAAALAHNASDVHVEVAEQEVVLRFRIDGVLVDVAHLPAGIWTRLISRIKGLAGLKINVSAVPQDGRITVKLEDETLDLRVSTLPSAFGESLVMRLLRSGSVRLEFENLGMRPSVFKILKIEMEKPNGMIITTGPTGSGKTTTMYAILNKLNKPETKIITLENPIEYRVAGIVQSQVDHSKGYDFPRGLRSILRQDPDIVMVGEIRDLETAQTAIDAALTGHLMLSTIHTNDAAGVVPRLLGMGVKGIFIAPALNAVIGQRLVRRIHEECKMQYTPPPAQLQIMKQWIANIPEKSGEKKPDLGAITLYKGRGCQQCGNTGYKGRVGIYEVFTMLPEIEKVILSGSVSEYDMANILHEAGMVTMGQDGMLKVVEGITTLDEVLRVAKK